MDKIKDTADIVRGIVGLFILAPFAFKPVNWILDEFNLGLKSEAEEVGYLTYPYWSPLFDAVCNSKIIREGAASSETEAERLQDEFIRNFAGSDTSLGLANEELIKYANISPEDAKFYIWKSFETPFGEKRGLAQDGFIEYKTPSGIKFVGYTTAATRTKAGLVVALCIYENDKVDFEGWNLKFHKSINNFHFY